MRLNILSDAEWQSGLGQIIIWLSKTSYWEAFEQRDYGSGLNGVSIFLICRYPEFEFKRRIRHSKKEKKIYMDIMLNLSDFVDASFEERKIKVLNALLRDVPEVVGGYSIKGFDAERFLVDFNEKFASLLAAAMLGVQNTGPGPAIGHL